MAEETGAAFGIYPSAGRRPERLNQSRGVNAPLQLLRGWAAGTLGLPGDIEGLVRMLPGIKNETPVLPTSDFYREYLPGYDERPAARAMSGLGAMAGGVGATNVAGAGLGALKRATDVNAIRDYIRATQGVSGMPGAAVVKPRGGNWLSGAGSPEEAVRGLKATAVGMDPAERIPLLDNLIREQEAAGAVTPEFLDRMRAERGRLTGDAELNRWIDQKLAKYIRNEMGTPEDPLRALVQERGISHLTEDDLMRSQAWVPDDLAERRVRAGFPEEGMAERLHAERGYPQGGAEDRARMTAGWEAEADRPIDVWTAGSLLDDMHLRENPWLAKVPPETPVYSIENAEQTLRTDLGFDHLVDELRNATRAGTDLPRELQLRPEQLSKVSMPQAVELVDRINKWRAAQKAEADLARAGNAATQTFKEYPEQGFKWVELRMPSNETMPLEERKALIAKLREEGGNPETWPREMLETALKYEGEVMGHCVGGYCPDVMEGRSRIFSLRDAKGQPHVTVEVTPKKLNNWDDVTAAVGKEKAKQLWAEFDALGGYKAENAEQIFNQLMQERGVQPLMDINQIKGKANKAPKDEYLPYVQDFVRSGRWGRVGDLQNTGLIDVNKLRSGYSLGVSNEDFQRLIDAGLRERGEALEGLRYGTVDDIIKTLRPEAGYARGGMVSAAGGPTQYDSAAVEARAAALMEEIYA